MLVEDKPQKTWRDSWFTKNVMAELPIVGAYFKKCTTLQMLSHAGKDVGMITGSAVGMYIHMMEHPDMNMNDPEGFAHMVVAMTLGMTGGAIVYNSLFGLGKVTYQSCKSASERNEEELVLAVETGHTPYVSF